MISMSGVFAVTFSVIFAYVADITQEHERSTAYGLVSRRHDSKLPLNVALLHNATVRARATTLVSCTFDNCLQLMWPY